jgi:hypothetical protein
VSTVETPYVVKQVSAEDYEPLMIEGEAIGEISWLRTASSGETQLLTGLWRCEPRTFEWVFPGDETMHVLEGEATVELTDTGEKIKLEPGDIASFNGGTKSTWTIESPFKKFTVISP